MFNLIEKTTGYICKKQRLIEISKAATTDL